jgi:hypothetical protein
MKYNRSEIMKNAWNIRRNANVDMATALKSAWALAKAMLEAETIGEESGWNYKVSANDWAKYGKNRTYVTTRIYTNAWNLKREIKLGYIDNMTGEFIAA